MPLYFDTPGLKFDDGYRFDQEEDFPLKPGEQPARRVVEGSRTTRRYRMNDRQRNQNNRLIRVKTFCDNRAAAFTNTPPRPGDVKFQTTRTKLGTLLTQIGGQQSTQAGGSFGQATSDQAAQRDELLELLRSVNRTAGAIAIDQNDPGLMDRFRMPVSHNDVLLATTGNAFADAIEELELAAAFTEHAYEGDIVADLRAEAEEMVQSEGDQGGAAQTQGAATAALPGLFRQGRDLVKCLDAIVKNRYRNDAATLGAWKIASHVTSDGGGDGEATPPAPTPPPA